MHGSSSRRRDCNNTVVPKWKQFWLLQLWDVAFGTSSAPIHTLHTAYANTQYISFPSFIWLLASCQVYAYAHPASHTAVSAGRKSTARSGVPGVPAPHPPLPHRRGPLQSAATITPHRASGGLGRRWGQLFPPNLMQGGDWLRCGFCWVLWARSGAVSPHQAPVRVYSLPQSPSFLHNNISVVAFISRVIF